MAGYASRCFSWPSPRGLHELCGTSRRWRHSPLRMYKSWTGSTFLDCWVRSPLTLGISWSSRAIQTAVSERRVLYGRQRFPLRTAMPKNATSIPVLVVQGPTAAIAGPPRPAYAWLATCSVHAPHFDMACILAGSQWITYRVSCRAASVLPSRRDIEATAFKEGVDEGLTHSGSSPA